MKSYLLSGFLIGLLIVIQFRSSALTGGSHPLDEYQTQKKLVQAFMDEQEALETDIGALRAELEDEEKRLSQYYQSLDSKARTLIKEKLGLTEVVGPGLEIMLADSPQADRTRPDIDLTALVHASDVRDVINILRTLPHRGISVNGRRVVHASPITNAGNSILINNFSVVPPFKIHVISDAPEMPELAIQHLSQEEELPDLYKRMVERGITFKFKEMDELTLPSYLGGYSTSAINALRIP